MGFLTLNDHQIHEQACEKRDQLMCGPATSEDGTWRPCALVMLLLEDARASYHAGGVPIGQIFIDPRQSDWERAIADVYDYGRGYRSVITVLQQIAHELDETAEVTMFAMNGQSAYGEFPKSQGLVVTLTIKAPEFVLEATK